MGSWIVSSESAWGWEKLRKAALEVLAELPRWENCPYVVPNPKTMKPYGSIQRSWDIARKAAGLPEVRMHDFRHSMASNMVNLGRSIYEVAKVLGHNQLKTTQRVHTSAKKPYWPGSTPPPMPRE